MGFNRKCCSVLDRISAGKRTYGYYPDISPSDDTFGQTLSDIARQIFPDCSEAEQLRLIDGCCRAEHEALLKKCAPLYEDLEKMLQIMYKKYPLYIVSNSQSGYIEVFLQTSGLEKYFKGHLCNGDTGLDKGSNIRKLADTYDLKSPCMSVIRLAITRHARKQMFLLSSLNTDSEKFQNRMHTSANQWILSIFLYKFSQIKQARKIFISHALFYLCIYFLMHFFFRYTTNPTRIARIARI